MLIPFLDLLQDLHAYINIRDCYCYFAIGLGLMYKCSNSDIFARVKMNAAKKKLAS